MIRSLVLVSAGLGLQGGGRAAAGRLIARGTARYADKRGMDFSVLSLGAADEPRFSPKTRHFAGSRSGLTAAALRAQSSQTGMVFDLLGLSRIQALLPSAWRSPYLVALFGIEVWRPLTWAHRRALHGASVVAAISRHTLERGQPFTGPLPQARVLPLTLEETSTDEPDGALGITPGYLLMVGRMASSERYKGHDLVLDALAIVLHVAPQTRLVIAGEGDDRPRLEQRARDLGLGTHVTFTGFVSDARLRALYRNAAAFVMPSTGEGFGLVYLEAMREGVPCVAARGSVAEEVLEGGAGGILVSPSDRPQLASALVRLLTDEHLRRRLGDEGRTRFETVYTTERFQTILTGMLDSLTDTAAPGVAVEVHVRN